MGENTNGFEQAGLARAISTVEKVKRSAGIERRRDNIAKLIDAQRKQRHYANS